jgi:hypothetical protein
LAFLKILKFRPKIGRTNSQITMMSSETKFSLKDKRKKEESKNRLKNNVRNSKKSEEIMKC